jgi:molybdopterin synthase sulfur carrier subunit
MSSGAVARQRGVKVLLHGAWRGLAAGAKEVRLDASTLREALDTLAVMHPSLAERLRDEHGRLRPHLALFVNEEDARLLGWEDAPLRDGDVVHVIPALSGG